MFITFFYRLARWIIDYNQLAKRFKIEIATGLKDWFLGVHDGSTLPEKIWNKVNMLKTCFDQHWLKEENAHSHNKR